MTSDSPIVSALEHGRVQSCGRAERKTRVIFGVTLLVMGVEIAVGIFSGSLALQADGWHMGTHAAALGLSILAYWFARTRASSPRYSFGTGKVDALAGYTSALALVGAAGWMAYEAFVRFLTPQTVRFGEAISVALLGLAFNVVSAWFLQHDHDHHHHGGDHNGHRHSTEQATQDSFLSSPAGSKKSAVDPNLEAVYLHVLADALTSVLAIAALCAGYFWHFTWLDPIVALLGAVVIAKWALGLVSRSAACLLDASPCVETQAKLIACLQALEDVRVLDFHLWEIAPGRQGCMATIVAQNPRPVAYYRRALLETANLAHVTVEVHAPASTLT